MSIGATNNTTGTSGTNNNGATAAGRSGYDDLGTDDFLKLLLTELSNQDPLNPMDNAQLVEQISAIRNISATTKLADTLEAVTTGQNLATATSMIGKKVKALSDKGEEIEGIADRVTVAVDAKTNTRTYRIHVNNNDIDLKNVREVYPAP